MEDRSGNPAPMFAKVEAGGSPAGDTGGCLTCPP